MSAVTVAAAPAIRLDGVSKTFPSVRGPLPVLENIGFSVRDGGVVALLGPSGCGKSTLLHIIAGLIAPDHGEVALNGIPVARFAAWPAVGYLFQDDRLLPWRSARRNVEFGLEAGPMPKRERRRRAEAALALVGLDSFAAAFPYQLSGGMRARVALARTLVREPRILLMDEPFSKLDALTRAQMHGELLRLQAQFGISILFVTHDVEEAVMLAETVIVLAPRPGRIRERVPLDLPFPRDPTSPAGVAVLRDLKTLLGSDA